MTDDLSSAETWAMGRLLRDLQEQSPTAPPGYEILGELGRGGMGVVYRAREVALDRVVALKVLIAGEDAPEELLERFEREARAAARLSHPNIVEVLSTGRDDALRWIAMRLVEGRSLADIGRVPARQAMDVVRKVALALDHAHSRGVLHRDVKPGNVLIDTHGEPQLADFGLARDAALGTLTVRGEILGTPAFASPEQVSGQCVDARSDVYSLGATLYAMLTGRAPFEGTSAARVVEAVLRDTPPPPAALVPDMPRDVEAICSRAMERDPSRRYASAAEMADDVQTFLEGGRIEARPRSHLHDWLVAAALSCVLGFAAWNVLSVGRATHTPRVTLDRVRARLLAQAGVSPAIAAVRRTEVSTVLSRWARLRGDLRQLEGTAHDRRLSADLRKQALAGLWAPFAVFKSETPADDVSQAAMRGLMGWAMVVRGDEEAGLAEMEAATALSPDVAIGRFMGTLVLFSKYVEGIPMPGVDLGPKGVEFEAVPSESHELARLRERMKGLLAEARMAPLWGTVGAEDFSAAIEGVLALQRGDLAAAERALTDAMTSPDLRAYETGLLLARGRVRYLAKRFDEALQDFHEVQTARPGEPDAFVDAAECAVAAATARIWRGEDPLPLLEEAIDAYGKAVEWDPDDLVQVQRRAHARRLRGEARQARGGDGGEDFEAAEGDLREAIRRGLDSEAVHLEVASLCVTLGRREAIAGRDFRPSYERAIAAYDRLIVRDGGSQRAWLGRGAAHIELAKAFLQRDMPQARGHFEQAVADLVRAVSLRPDDVLALTNRGGAWIGLGTAKLGGGESGVEEFRSAIADFDAVLEIDAEYTAAYNNRAGAWGLLGNALKGEGKEPWECYDHALADFGEVLKRNSGEAAHWNNRAMLHHLIGEVRAQRGQDPKEEYAAATSDFSEALTRNPRLWVARLSRGQIHEKLGEHAEAADDYEAAYDVVGEAYPGLPDMIRRERERAAKDPRR